MDPVTHTLVGATVAGRASRTVSRPAMLLGGLSALVPDLDVFLTKSDDPLFQLELHRQFSHALISFPLLALLLSGLFCRLFPKRLPLRTAYLASFLGLISAGLLDACTSYGTQLLWPFTTQRFAFNVVPVVDPLFTLGLIALVGFAAYRSSKVGMLAAVCWLAFYLTFGAVQHQRARNAMEAEFSLRGESPKEIVIKPTLGNQILWRATAIVGDTVVTSAVRTGYRVSITPGESRSLCVVSRDFSHLQGTRAYRDLERFSELSQGYLTRHPEWPNVIGDARYAMLPTSLSPLWALEFDPSRPKLPPKFLTFRDSGPQVRAEFWKQLKGER